MVAIAPVIELVVVMMFLVVDEVELVVVVVVMFVVVDEVELVVGVMMFVVVDEVDCLFVACLKSQQHASVSQGRWMKWIVCLLLA